MSFKEDLFKVMNYSWVPYKGLLVQVLPGNKLKWGQTIFKTIEELDVAIEEARKSLSYSIKK